MIACPACAQEWPDDARFCMHCGVPLAPPLASPEERKVITSLFCDLVGFTQACERADPEDIDRLLRGYNAMARRIIAAHGGTVEKFIGDAVVAIFGVPVAHEDDPERAVRAGLRIVQEAEEMRGLASDCLRLRVGVNTGEALVRLDVTPGSGEGFVTGDAVNTAARLQAAAPVMGVVIGAATRDLVAGKFELEELAPVDAKGKTAPVAAWRVIAARSRLGAASQRRHATPLIGRDTEQAFITALFEKAVSAPVPQVVLLVGEPGIGKTRLVSELFAYIDARPGLVRWREGRCLPYGDGVTFSALGEMMKAEAGILETDDRDTAARKLDLAVTQGDDHDWVLGRLRALVGLETPEAARDENFMAWLQYLEALAASGPLVLIFEDLHWADEALLAFVEYLSRQASALPIFVVGTARPELFERHPTFAASAGRLSRFTLDRLSAADTERLVATLLDAHASPALVETIVRRSDGNPYYAEESARLVVDKLGAGLEIIDGSSTPAGLTSEAPLPGSVQAILAARLDSLPAALKAVLADAAIVGDVFWTGVLAAVGDLPREDVDHLVAELIDRQLVRRSRTSTMAGEQELSFWHALAREVAYQQQPRAVRAHKHAAVAVWLEESAGERIEDIAEVLAHHYVTALDLALSLDDADLAAELTAPAARHLTMAGEHATRLDLPTALKYYSHALEILPDRGLERGLALRLQAHALCLSSRPREGIEAYLEAIDCLLEGGDRNAAACSEVDMSLWMATAADNRWRERITRIHEIVDESAPTRDLVQTYQELAGVQSVRLWDHQAALRSADRALEVAARLGLPEPPGAYEWRSEAKAALGDGDYVADYERALELAHEQDLGSNAISRLRCNHVHITSSLVGPAAAGEELRASIDFAQRRGMDFWISAGRCSMSALLLAQGRWEEAEEEATTLASQLAEAGWGEGEELTIVSAVQGALLARTGRSARGTEVDEADRLAAWLPERAEVGKNDQLLSATCLLTAAELSAARDKTDQARQLLARCLDEPGVGPWGACCEGSREGLLSGAVRLALLLGDDDLARRFLAAAAPLSPVDEHALVSSQALLAETGGDHETAAELFADAAARWGSFGVPYEEAHALLGSGRSLLTLGHATEAVKSLRAAREIFSRLGAAPALADSDALLTAAQTALQGVGLPGVAFAADAPGTDLTRDG